jgi:transposase
MSSEELKRYNISGIPLIKSVSDLLGLKEIFSKHIGSYGNEKVPACDTLLLLIWNITLGRQPLYELSRWIKDIDPGCHGLNRQAVDALNDDRFARALDKLYMADRATIMTEIVVKMIKKVDLDMSRIHNDSTTVKAYGKIGGTTKDGLRMANGKSKDHRPDLKQLLFSLTISSDGAIPVHYKTYPGNRTDDTTHIETWDTVRKIAGTGDFTYVADCKVCTQKQLSYIVANGGRVITTMPDTWKESKSFKEVLRTKKIPRKVILRRKIPGSFSESSKLNRAKLKTKKQIKERIEAALKKEVAQFFDITIYEKHKCIKKQVGRGRPGPDTKYQIHESTSYSLLWEPDKKRLRQEENIDGIFPLLTTEESFGPKEVLSSYKYQPRLEKRFNQFKSVHEAAPLLFKKIERVEAIMFLFFMALMVQGIIERKVRLAMKEKSIKSLPIYPEYRSSFYPTTSKIFYNFDSIFSYKILKDDKVVKEFKDNLSSAQKTILDLLDIEESQYWG